MDINIGEIFNGTSKAKCLWVCSLQKRYSPLEFAVNISFCTLDFSHSFSWFGLSLCFAFNLINDLCLLSLS